MDEANTARVVLSDANDSVILTKLFYYSPAPVWMRCIVAPICLFAFVFGGISNLTTLVAFARNRQILWKRQYVNVAGLAVTDGIVCVFTCSHHFLEYATGNWMFSGLYCDIHWAITSWAFYGGFHMLMLVSYDRYLIIRHGVNYGNVETWQKIIFRTVSYAFVEPAIWSPVFFINLYTGVSVNQPGVCLLQVFQLGYIYPILCSVTLLIPVAAMAFCYLKVYNFTRHQQRRRPQQTRSQLNLTAHASINQMSIGIIVPAFTQLATKDAPRLVKNQQREKRASRIIKYLFASLLIFYAPYGFATVIMLLITTNAIRGADLEWWSHFYVMTQVIGLINNALNPMLYAYTMPKLNDTMTNVWKDVIKWIPLCVKPSGTVAPSSVEKLAVGNTGSLTLAR